MTDDTQNRPLEDVAAQMYIDGYAAFARSLELTPGSPDREAALREAALFQGAGFDLHTIADAA